MPMMPPNNIVRPGQTERLTPQQRLAMRAEAQQGRVGPPVPAPGYDVAPGRGGVGAPPGAGGTGYSGPSPERATGLAPLPDMPLPPPPQRPEIIMNPPSAPSSPMRPQRRVPMPPSRGGMAKGGQAKAYAKGGSIDGCAQRGKTKGRVV